MLKIKTTEEIRTLKAKTILEAFDAMLNQNSIYNVPDDADKLEIDTSVLDVSKGLFGNQKQMSGESFKGGIFKKNTLLKQAKYNLICSVYENKTPTIFPLTGNEESIIHELYTFKTSKTRILTKKLEKKVFKDFKDDMMKKFESGQNKLKTWITRDEFEEMLMTMFRSINLIKVSQDCVIPETIENRLKELHYLLSQTNFTIHHGHAGCGKSTDVANYVNELLSGDVVEISLSNTICNMFRNKIYNSRIKFKTYSCTAANFSKIENKRVIILDEFSQWGYNELDLLIKLLEKNPAATFLMMGDIDQIPTFLSGGSLLYSIMTEFPDNVKEHNITYRFQNNPSYGDLIKNIQDGKLPPNWFINEINDEVIKQADCIITGTNENVDKLNLRAFFLKHYIPEIENTSISNNIFDWCCQYNDIPLVSTKTTTLTYKTEPQKIYCNSKYKIIDTSRAYKTISLEDLVTGSHITIRENDLKWNFSLCYAMNVNKAQGLEWENIIVYITQNDYNLKNYNAFYVALSRGKNNVVMTTSKNKAIVVTQKDLIGILNRRYRFENDF